MKERPIRLTAPLEGFTPPNCEGVHSCIVEDGVAKFHLNGILATHSGEWTECPYGKPGNIVRIGGTDLIIDHIRVEADCEARWLWVVEFKRI